MGDLLLVSGLVLLVVDVALFLSWSRRAAK